jgi:hypothetical protein
MKNKNVTFLPPSENYNVEQALNSALNIGSLTDILIVGYDEDGDLFIRSSYMTRAEAVFLLEKAKQWAFNA